MHQSERVAIVGIGGIFPGATDLERFWENVSRGVDTTREVPPGRWLLAVDDAFDPRVGAPDRVYATRGGFIEGFQLDPDGLDLDPALIERLDPTFHLALHAARQAWHDAQTANLDRQRVGVVFGNIVLPTETASSLARETLGRTFAERAGFALEPDTATDPLNTFVAGLPAGIVARALGLGGGSFTLDAACASSLYAIKLAADELLAGRADAMVTGGLSRPDPLYTQMGFSQLRALSSTGRAHPFDDQAAGLIVGEGAGMFVLKRLTDALRDGDRIYATIAAIGLSNDVDGGLLAPSSEGQLRAMRAAYDRAGWDPREIDLIECHATGTPVGDAVEFASLRTLWGDQGWQPGHCVIGSVKSNIGHALTAAGSAALLKVLFALRDKTLPPTANFTQPGSRLDYADGPFRVLTESEPWNAPNAGRPRRAALSGFGFGGINAHALIEEWIDADRTPAAAPTAEPQAPAEGIAVAIVGIGARFGPFAGLQAVQERVLGGNTNPSARPVDAWWGAEAAPWYRREGFDPASRQGYPIETLELRADRYRIPPRELEEMLPQQSLALEVAAEAIADAGWDDQPKLRAGVFIGIELDPNTTNFHVRWSLLNQARRWNEQHALSLDPEQLTHWVDALRDAAGPPLTANRTMGALGGLVASRIAREFRVGGPSFTLSSEETSGLHALDVAVRLLEMREIDEAIVGAVDLACDLRTVLAGTRLHGTTQGPRSDGAAALIVKRLDDAVRDGDRVYAVIKGVGAAGGDPASYREAIDRALREAHSNPSEIGYLDTSAQPGDSSNNAFALGQPTDANVVEPTCALASARADVGDAGAASGLASLVKAAVSLYQQVLSPIRDDETRPPHDSALFAPRTPQFWLRDRARGPRKAAVAATGEGGTSLGVVLEGFEPQAGLNSDDRLQPLGPRKAALFAIEADDEAGLRQRVDALDHLAATASEQTIEELARRWWQEHPNDPTRRFGTAIVAHDLASLRTRLGEARNGSLGAHSSLSLGGRGGSRGPLGPADAGLAFVFPGLGNLFAGMGRELSALWPELLRTQDQESLFLQSQLGPGTFWNADPPDLFADHRAPILGQVSLGCLVSDLIRKFGVEPRAILGYSLGESTGLFALRAWTERDDMLERIETSPLFRTELAGPCEAARRTWGLPEGEPADWVAGIVPYPEQSVRAVLPENEPVYLMMVNTPRETIIGGRQAAVKAVVERLGGRFFALPIVSTIHCPVALAVEPAYRAMHLLTTTPPAGVRYYSGATGDSYVPDRESAADAIVAHAVHGIDFPTAINRAYDDGIRVFVEIGPGASCSRMIGRILGDRPHLARSACVPGEDPLDTLLDLLARLIAERIPVDLAPLYASAPEPSTRRDSPGRRVRVECGGKPFHVPPPPPPRPEQPPQPPQQVPDAPPSDDRNPYHDQDHDQAEPSPIPPAALPRNRHQGRITVPTLTFDADPLTRQLVATETSKADAHEAYLRVSGNIGQTLSNQLAFQMALIEALMVEAPSAIVEHDAVEDAIDEPRTTPLAIPTETPRSLNRVQCMEFAVGAIGTVLGAEFSEIDAHPTRVRLPDEPLMLVDRIVAIEGDPRSLGGGRVITEHDVLPDAWYLDGGRIPTCIAVESGQADLFLSGFLGIDFVTKGLAVYRLLDAVVTFYRGLPGPGSVIRYDIYIDHFFRQGDTYLFRFHFEATVDGEPLMSMRDGCAGFFTAEELAAGQGIVAPRLERQTRAAGKPVDWVDLVPMAVESYSEAQVDALRRGDLATAFGAAFADLPLRNPTRLPGGLMTLVHRVLELDPKGGKFGLGRIRAEADIDPSDWFMTCHFVDDRVMPGTLMFECCLHTLRIFLTRMGWVGEHDEMACEPVPGIASRLKCRGQVIESTRVVTYEVSIKELGYGPEPYAVVDALMYADGRPVVEITDMSLRMTGLTREALTDLWQNHQAPAIAPSAPDAEPTPLYDQDRILAFAIGKPSEAFGAPYRVFDAGRVIARLPGPPFQFLDRITGIRGEPWKMVPGAEIEARYDVPPDAWYFGADRQTRMPFAVLLETALQPCGWLAAYIGSALTSDEDLKFRNLGGSATTLAEVTPDTGTLITDIKITKVSTSGGMIIQHYDMAMRSSRGPVYRGDTYFGFFRAEALANQIGLRDATLYQPGAGEQAQLRSFDFPTTAPFSDPRLRMIDRVDAFIPDGGPHGLGFIQGSQAVDAAAWYFQAHFYQDPVCPGSLGLESFMQLLKVVARERWGAGPRTAFESVGLNHAHRWTYRGQVLPTDNRVTVQAVITEIDDRRLRLKADGYLTVDGRTIFQMNDFTLRIAEKG